MSPEENRILSIERKLQEVGEDLSSAEARAARVGQALWAERLGDPALDYTPGETVITGPVLVLSSCFGNPPIVGADVWVYDGSGNLQSITPTNKWGYAELTVPPGGGNVIAYATKFTKSALTAIADPGPLVTLTLAPNSTTGYSLLPAVTITDPTGSGAAASYPNTAGPVMSAPGTGYTAGVGISFGGYYGTGLDGYGILGVLSSVTIGSPGSGYSGLTATINPGGTAAAVTIKGSAIRSAEDFGVTNAGSGYAHPPSLAVGALGAVTVSGARNATGAGSTLSGSTVGGILLDDPGYGYVPGATIGGTLAGGRGIAGVFAATTSGGAYVAASITGRGYGYITTPTVSVGGAGSGAAFSLGIDATGLGRVQATTYPDLWGRFGLYPDPVEITGTLRTSLGDLAMEPPSSGALVTTRAVRYLYPSGSIYNSTVPDVNTGRYPVAFGWTDRHNATFTATITAGVVTAITIIDPSYGFTAFSASIALSQSLGLDVAFGTGAAISFTVDGDGGITGYTIDNGGSGYRIGGSANGTGAVRLIGNGVGSAGISRAQTWPEYELAIYCPSFVYLGTRYPTGAIPASLIPFVTSEPAASVAFLAKARASTYGLVSGRFEAVFDFTGTLADVPVFQGASPVVTFEG